MLERIRFIKVNRHKNYDYTPMYYDERKEKLKAMVSSYEDKEGKSEEQINVESKERMRLRLQNSWSAQAEYKNKSRAANLRLIVILIALIVIVYVIFGVVDTYSSDVTIVE